MKGLIQIVENAKVAVITSTSTMGSGVATWLEWIPADIGKLMSLIGGVLTIVLIVTHTKKGIRDDELHDIEMERKIIDKKIRDIMLKKMEEE